MQRNTAPAIMEGDNSISVSVRVRPLTSRESASLHVESAPDSLFQTGASLSAGSSNLTSHRAAGSGLRRILQVVECVASLHCAAFLRLLIACFS